MGKQKSMAWREQSESFSKRPSRAATFMFATGIENSYPTAARPDGTVFRVDEMAKSGHYERWREDFSLVRELGLHFLRWGPPYYRVHLGPGRYDWAYSDDALAELNLLDITPIVDLCHFGVPDWIGSFQNPEWPHIFAEYAGAFATRYPWVRLYTPVNEIFVAARFSAKIGWWNERLSSDSAFVNALKHLVQANLLAQQAILLARPGQATLFVQSESTEYFHAGRPEATATTGLLNQQRFLSLDLCYGRDVRASMYRYLIENGLTPAEYDWFMQMGRINKPFSIMGNDYYVTNEHLVHGDDGPITASGEIFGYYVITKQYYDRYHLPVMHTETNLADADAAPSWLWKQWANMMRLRQDGVPIVGFTWYSLTDQVDWDSALRDDAGRVNPLGLFDLNRRIRPVGAAYRRLVETWRDDLLTDYVSSAEWPP